LPTIRFLRDSTGAKIAYAVHGSGPLVICPPWWVSHVEKDWAHKPFRDFFETLGQDLQVVRFDRPGVGLSDRDIRPRTFEDEVRLLGEIADAMGQPPRYSLFAMSFGGPIAIHHAVHNPGRVERICFFGSFLDGDQLSSPDIRAAFLAMVRAHWGIATRAFADVFFPDEPRETVDFSAQQMRYSSSAEVAAGILERAYAARSSDIVDRVEADCLIIHREGDRAVPYEAGRALASRLRNGRFVTYRGTAHPPWYDGPAIARLANAFLRGSIEEVMAPEGGQEPRQQEPSPDCRLDADNRCLVINGRNVALTPLEFGLLRALVDRPRQVVTRDALLSEVWHQPFEGSNRIDAVVSALRKKLAEWSASVETVTGHGYRFTQWQRKPLPD
jgi:pimeloyl-ACP methyl ester carboxylesterase